MNRDRSVPARMFIGVAAFIAVIGTVYWFASYEEAGTTMLALAAGLAALCGGWLLLQERKAAAGSTGHEHDHEEHYLPAASAWPFAVGVGAALTLNGLIIGWPYAVPGGLVLALALTGFVAEARRRA